MIRLRVAAFTGIVVALASTVLFPVAAAALQLPPVTRATLDNGLQVIVAETHELLISSERLADPCTLPPDTAGWYRARS